MTATIPDGTDDTSVNAFTNGLDGRTLYANSAATASVAPTYFSAVNNRPNTVYEQLAALYTYADNINSTLSGQISGLVFAASNIAVADSSGLYDSTNVEDALEEVMTSLNTIQDGIYLPLTGGTMGGSIIMDSGSLIINSNSGKVEHNMANGQVFAMKSMTVELTSMSGASVNATNLIPAKSVVVGVTSRVTVALEGCSSYDLGKATNVDLFANNASKNVGSTTDNSNWTDSCPQVFNAAEDMVVTAVGSPFTAGSLRITVHYFEVTAPTS